MICVVEGPCVYYRHRRTAPTQNCEVRNLPKRPFGQEEGILECRFN